MSGHFRYCIWKKIFSFPYNKVTFSFYPCLIQQNILNWLLLGAGALLVVYLLRRRSRRDVFAQRGVASAPNPLPFFGNTVKSFSGRNSFSDQVLRLYGEARGHRVFGFLQFQTPLFLVRDLDVLKAVMIKDFDHFTNRMPIATQETDPFFSQSLFNLSDQRWKDMRTTLSPAFTTSKIKRMFLIISDCTSQTVQHLREEHEALTKNGQKQPLEVDMKNLFTRLANDVIATVAFGVNCDSQKEANNEFYLMGKELTTFKFWGTLKFMVHLISPKIAQVLGLRVFGKKATTYFDSLVQDTIKERQQKGIFRPDVLQLLMQAREGQLKAEAGDEQETEKFDTKYKLTDTDISAQSIGFFFAGFETVSTALCYTTYALSRHPDAQLRLQEEIDVVLRETGGKLTYDAIQGMKYLDAVINESLRLFPPVQAVNRVCREDLVIPATESSATVRFCKGDAVFLPIMGLHRDPDHFPDPDAFDPERFSDENKHNIKPCTYMPFGMGPRFCIEFILQMYREGRGHRVFGFRQFQQPFFLVRDPEVLKSAMVKDFDHFTNRVPLTTQKADPIFSQTLFNLSDQRWKDMRTTLSPAFTTSKIKRMFLIISDCTSQTVQHLREQHEALIKNGQKQPLEVDMKNLFTRLANDVVATVAFGVNCDSQKEANNEFYLIGKELTTFSLWRILMFMVYLIAPKIAEFLGLRVFGYKATTYFDLLVQDTIKERQQKGIFRPDMLQLLMQAREGQLKAEAGDEQETEKFDTKYKLTDTDISAQSIGFFFAGFDTVSTALCFTAYALSRHPDAQLRLHEEVDAVMKETGGKPTYEAIQGMKYLDAVINESLRLFPPVQALNRVCREDLVIPATESSAAVRFCKGDALFLPVFGLHRDPEHFPDPDAFDPERFSDENKHNIKPCTYMPFGMGPRFCIEHFIDLKNLLTFLFQYNQH
ncbi:Cytochrome P450 [Gryllus bimaculatus]|nr:Cytochrome P450 [Gryllus bimaculatus]